MPTQMEHHTPGPWVAEHESDPAQVGTEAGRFVAMTLPCSDSCIASGEDYANARLIAAAPDLLAALEEIGATQPLPVNAIRAIAKARARFI